MASGSDNKFNGASSDSTPQSRAREELEELSENWGDECVRLFLTLAAFGWMELWCPQAFLIDKFNFKFNAMKTLRLECEVECDERSEAEKNNVLRLIRHPKLCELFLDEASRVNNMFYREYIFHPTCTAMGIESDLVEILRFFDSYSGCRSR